jgi:hypothetical protein
MPMVLYLASEIAVDRGIEPFVAWGSSIAIMALYLLLWCGSGRELGQFIAWLHCLPLLLLVFFPEWPRAFSNIKAISLFITNH